MKLEATPPRLVGNEILYEEESPQMLRTCQSFTNMLSAASGASLCFLDVLVSLAFNG